MHLDVCEPYLNAGWRAMNCDGEQTGVDFTRCDSEFLNNVVLIAGPKLGLIVEPLNLHAQGHHGVRPGGSSGLSHCIIPCQSCFLLHLLACCWVEGPMRLQLFCRSAVHSFIQATFTC